MKFSILFLESLKGRVLQEERNDAQSGKNDYQGVIT